jgi:hypothetical protein
MHVRFIPNELFTVPEFSAFSFVQNGNPELSERNHESSARELYVPLAEIHVRLADICSLK